MQSGLTHLDSGTASLLCVSYARVVVAVCAGACTHVCRSRRWISVVFPLPFSHLMFWHNVSRCTWRLKIWQDLPGSELPWSYCPCLAELGVQRGVTSFVLSHGCLGSTSCPHAHTTRTFLTKLSPHPQDYRPLIALIKVRWPEVNSSDKQLRRYLL